MVQVHFRSHDLTIDVPAGASLLEAVRRARLRLEAPCNGGGTCGKCRVRLNPEAQGRIRRVASRNLSDEDAGQGWALLCSTLLEDDIVLDLPVFSERGLRILEDGVRADLPLSPWISKRFRQDREVTEVRAGPERLGDEAGDTATRSFGVAVDIGSTTIVASLIDLTSGRTRGSASSLNPQALHAQDVLSRIQLASTPEGLALLHGEVVAEIDRLIGLLASEARIPRRRIYEVVLAGNTCMLHLAANVDPEPLGRFPYQPVLRGHQYFPARSLGLAISPFGIAYAPPVVSGFVGADITAGILSVGLSGSEGVGLFIDIGTNGELVLARDGRLQATSTAAGPAFEGMNIACGMRAARGAIERVSLEDDRVELETIDQAPAIGLCGSGLLDAVAELARHEVIGASGRFARTGDGLPPELASRLARRDGKPVFHLTPEVFLSQGDIRQVQLAKGAVRAGIDILLRRNGLTASDVGRILIAGSFGYHLTVRSLLDIGLFPREFEGRVEYVGNSSRTGAEALLTNAPSRDALAGIVGGVETVDLVNDPDFTDAFVAAMAFPSPAGHKQTRG